MLFRRTSRTSIVSKKSYHVYIIINIIKKNKEKMHKIFVAMVSLGYCFISLFATTACNGLKQRSNMFDWEKNGVMAYAQAIKILQKDDQRLPKRGEVMYYRSNSTTEVKWRIPKNHSPEQTATYRHNFKRQATPQGRKEHFEKFFTIQTAGSEYPIESLRGVRGLFAKEDLKANSLIGGYGGTFMLKSLESPESVQDVQIQILGDDFLRCVVVHKLHSSDFLDPTYDCELGYFPSETNLQLQSGVTATHARMILRPVGKENLSPASLVNSARGPNDSPGANAAYANAKAMWIKLPDELPMLIYYTTKAVKAGDQLLLEDGYGEGYAWKSEANKEIRTAISKYIQRNPQLNRPQKLYADLKNPDKYALDTEFFGIPTTT